MKFFIFLSILFFQIKALGTDSVLGKVILVKRTVVPSVDECISVLRGNESNSEPARTWSCKKEYKESTPLVLARPYFDSTLSKRVIKKFDRCEAYFSFFYNGEYRFVLLSLGEKLLTKDEAIACLKTFVKDQMLDTPQYAHLTALEK